MCPATQDGVRIPQVPARSMAERRAKMAKTPRRSLKKGKLRLTEGPACPRASDGHHLPGLSWFQSWVRSQ